MTIYSEFFEHANFGGDMEAFELNNNWRYKWIKFGGQLGNEITSLRGQAYGGTAGNIYGFAERNFLGDFAALNMAEGWTSWWSNVGSAMNDDIESAIMVNRSQNELVVELADQIAGPFADGFDKEIEGTEVSRHGAPRIYVTLWPSFDPNRKFVTIEQDLRVAVNWWPDYDVRYHIYLYLNTSNQVSGYVAWTYCWVEGGIFSGSIFEELHPRLVDGASTLTDLLQEQLALMNLLAALGGYSFNRLYLLPGIEPRMPPPATNFGRMGTAKEDATLVLTY